MDYLREGIGLRGYGQRDPLVEYKKESFEMFMDMQQRIKEKVIMYLYHIQDVTNIVSQEEKRKEKVKAQIEASKGSKTVVRKKKKIGRNDPCPCGSGKKYKKCCGRFAS